MKGDFTGPAKGGERDKGDFLTQPRGVVVARMRGHRPSQSVDIL